MPKERDQAARAGTARAVELWERRGDALKTSSVLLEEKPDRDEWTPAERRAFIYASAVSRRLGKLN